MQFGQTADQRVSLPAWVFIMQHYTNVLCCHRVSVCPSICLSLCLSNTMRRSTEMVTSSITQTMLHDNPV